MFNPKFKPIQEVAGTYGPHRGSPVCIDLKYALDEIKSPVASDTAYLNSDELKDCLVKLNPQDGNLYLGGRILDTRHYTSKSGQGKAAYAMDASGRLYIAEHRSPANTSPTTVFSAEAPVRPDANLPRFQYTSSRRFFYHSSFFGSKPGVCFGMLEARDGKITYLDNHSGHYRPKESDLLHATERLAHALRHDCEINNVSHEPADEGYFEASMFSADY